MVLKTPDHPFIVMNGDLLTNVNMDHLLNFHEQYRSQATMCVKEYDYKIPFGAVKTDNHKLISIQEKPIQRFFINAGIYVLAPEVLTLIPKDTCYDMPSLFSDLIKKKWEWVDKNPRLASWLGWLKGLITGLLIYYFIDNYL